MRAKYYAHALYEALKDIEGKERDRRFLNFITLLTRKSELRLLPAIYTHVKKIAEDERRDRTVVVITPKPLEGEACQRILEKEICADVRRIPKKVIQCKTDQKLIGGFIVHTRDKMIDASHKRALLQLYQTLIRPFNFARSREHHK